MRAEEREGVRSAPENDLGVVRGDLRRADPLPQFLASVETTVETGTRMPGMHGIPPMTSASMVMRVYGIGLPYEHRSQPGERRLARSNPESIP